jgi:hypothetical protein
MKNILNLLLVLILGINVQAQTTEVHLLNAHSTYFNIDDEWKLFSDNESIPILIGWEDRGILIKAKEDHAFYLDEPKIEKDDDNDYYIYAFAKTDKNVKCHIRVYNWGNGVYHMYIEYSDITFLYKCNYIKLLENENN